jgi:5-formyltetrahydrofolate cyclo-ligase
LVNDYCELTFPATGIDVGLKINLLEMTMEEVREKKQEIRDNIARKIGALGPDEVAAKTKAIEERLFEFANFLEARIVLLYTPATNEVDTTEIIKRSTLYSKIIVLPAYDPETHKMSLLKIDDPAKDLVQGPRGNLEPNAARCKVVPLDCLDIAIIPGLAMDEKGGRIGMGQGYYDRLIPDLPITTRKVGLVFEDQIVPLVPLESHDKHVDIVVTEKRVIYKI